MGHIHLLDEIFALMRHFSINFGVSGRSAFACQPGNGFEKGTLSCVFFKNTSFANPPWPFPERAGFWQLKKSFLAFVYPTLAPHPCLLCRSPFLSAFSRLGACTYLPARRQMLAVFTGCWAFGYLFFQGRLGGKRRITGCWGFFPSCCGGDCFTSG